MEIFEIYSVNYPDTKSPNKRRPFLFLKMVDSDSTSMKGVKITTTPNQNVNYFKISDYKAANLDKPSFIDLDTIVILKTDYSKKIGKLTPKDINSFLDEFLKYNHKTEDYTDQYIVYKFFKKQPKLKDDKVFFKIEDAKNRAEELKKEDKNIIKTKILNLKDNKFIESLEESKEKIRYYYNGPLYRFESVFRNPWEGYTEAVSERQAINNLNAKAKKEFGFKLDAKLNIDPKYLEVSIKHPNDDDFKDVEPIKYCDICGTRLNDAGECPQCDLGDKSVLDEAHRDDPEVKELTHEIRDDVERLNNLGISTKKIANKDELDRLCNIDPLDEDIEKQDELVYKVAEKLKNNINSFEDELITLSQVEGVDVEEIKQREPIQIAKALVEESIIDFRMFEDNDLEEDIEKHDTLNPKLFDGEELKPEVKEAIEKIAEQFIKELEADEIKINLKDIVLLGSNVSYNYTKDSDLDIHLIADSTDLNCPDELYPLLYSAYRSMFNKNYDIKIKGIPAEIYVEMDEPAARSNGIYSLNSGWIKKPEQTAIPDLDKEAFEKLFTEWEDKYFDLIGE